MIYIGRIADCPPVPDPRVAANIRPRRNPGILRKSDFSESDSCLNTGARRFAARHAHYDALCEDGSVAENDPDRKGCPVPNDNEWTVPHLTRRELLAQAGCSAVIFSAAPYLKAMESPLAAGASPPRITESFDFGWRFARDDASGAEQPGFKDAGWRHA